MFEADHIIVTTSLGVLKPTVLPFGIHGGPTGFQVCVNDAFKELIRAKKVKAFHRRCGHWHGGRR